MQAYIGCASRQVQNTGKQQKIAPADQPNLEKQKYCQIKFDAMVRAQGQAVAT